MTPFRFWLAAALLATVLNLPLAVGVCADSPDLPVSWGHCLPPLEVCACWETLAYEVMTANPKPVAEGQCSGPGFLPAIVGWIAQWALDSARWSIPIETDCNLLLPTELDFPTP